MSLKRSKLSQFQLGEQAALKMSAVEGIHMSPDTRKMFLGFRDSGLSPEEQRSKLLMKVKSEAGG